MPPFRGLEWPDMDSEQIAAIPEPMRSLLVELLLHKSLFVGEWFEHVSGPWAEARDTFAAIRVETLKQAAQATELMTRWSEHAGAHESAARAAQSTRRRLLENLVNLKKGSTEVFLSAGMRAPNEAIRREFVRLADLDREHADRLRALIDEHGGPAKRVERSSTRALGTNVEGPEAGSLRHRVEKDVASLRAHDALPMRLVVSAEALRHLRDEGAVDMAHGTVCDIPAEVDFGWTGDAYAFTTSERLTLAEVYTELTAPDHPDHHQPAAPLDKTHNE